MGGITRGGGGPGGIQSLAAAFSFLDYPNLIRWDATDVSKMEVRTAASFSSGKFLQIDSAALTAYDFTMCCWFKTTTTGAQTLIWVGDKDVANEYQALQVSGTAVSAISVNAGGTGSAVNTSIDPDDGSWHFAAGAFAVDDRAAYADATVTSDVTSISIGATYDRTAIGHTATPTPGDNMTGEIDSAMIFSTKLTGAQINWIRTAKPTLSDLQNSTHADNPGTANLVAYWDLNEQDGQTREDSHGAFDLADTGTVLAADGNVVYPGSVGESVYRLLELSGNNFHLAQTTYASRPVVVSVADGSGIALEFDGTDDYMQTAAFGADYDIPNDFFLCQEIDTISGNNTHFDGIGAAKRNWFYTDANQWRFYAGSFVNVFSTLNVPVADLYMMVVRAQATQTIGYEGGGTPTEAGSAGSDPIDGITVGAQYDGTTNFNFNRLRHLAVNNGTLADDDVDLIARDLAERQGLTWTDIIPP